MDIGNDGLPIAAGGLDRAIREGDSFFVPVGDSDVVDTRVTNVGLFDGGFRVEGVGSLFDRGSGLEMDYSINCSKVGENGLSCGYDVKGDIFENDRFVGTVDFICGVELRRR